MQTAGGDELHPGSAVVLQGLAQRAELNGSVGTVVEVDFLASGRCTVDLGAGLRPVRVKPANLDVIGPEHSAYERFMEQMHIGPMEAPGGGLSPNWERREMEMQQKELDAHPSTLNTPEAVITVRPFGERRGLPPETVPNKAPSIP